jgi:hypothetical protein
MRHFRTALAATAASITMAAAMVAPVHAQDTTSSIRGSVTSNGSPVAGASIEVVNVGSGARSTATTDASGAFTVNGLRPGGPYTVSVKANGYNDYQVTDIDTIVAQVFELPVELAAADQGEAIVVTASRLPGAQSISQGPATVLSSSQIANIPTINRDIRDLARRDPFARLDDSPGGGRAISFAGQNARYNRFSVDGVPITDNFGLNTDGLPSRRSPIPLDAIGQFQAKVAPYDVREGNFQGGAINIVLRSGTNDFQGTGFYAQTNDELSGSRTKPGPGVPTGKVKLPNFKTENYGAELSGPIIRDRVFFMIAGERVRGGRPLPEGTDTQNAGTVIGGVTQAQVDQISQIANDRYGYDTGGVLNSSGDKDDRIVGKIDANLSDTQRFSLTGTYAKDTINNNGSNTFTTTPTGLGLASNAYKLGNQLYTGVAQLNSEWSDSFSTEVRGFYKDYKRIQDPLLGRGFAQVQVCTAPTSDRATGVGTSNDLSTSCQVPNGTVSFGPDISRQTNALTSKTWGGLVQGRLTMNDHDLRVFASYEDTKVFNSFLQRSSGDYYFDSIADYVANNAQRFRYGNAIPSNVPDDAAAAFRYQAYTFGAMDTWRFNNLLNISYGARYDLYGGNSLPALSQTFFNRTAGYVFPDGTVSDQFTNQAYLSGRGIFQPRFGFDYKPLPRLSIRGGVGIFSGGTPDVYVSNSFSNTGILTNSIDIRQNNNSISYTGTTVPNAQAILNGVDPSTVPGVANTILNGAALSTTAPPTTNALDPHFKIPSQWRATLSANYDADLGPLGDHWRFGANLFYSAVRDQVFFTDLRVRPNGLLTPDGRQRYTPVTAFADTNSDILLTNSSKGRSYVGVVSVDKNFDFDLSTSFSFTYQDIKDQNPATSSTAGSNYAAGVSLDPNGPAYGVSNDEVKYAFKYSLTYDHAFFGDYKTTFALFGETRIGRPYSYTFRDTGTRSSVFGTIGTGTRYLMYVPTGMNDPLVSFDTAANAAAFDAYVDANGLKKYRGKIAPRNGFNSPWFTRLDLHLAQELPAFINSKARFQIFADVENFTNLINKKWGQIREFAFPYTISPVQVQCLTAPVATGTTPTSGQTAANAGQACTQYRYKPNQTGPADSTGATFVAPTDTIYANQSLYAIRVGVRVSF